VKIDIKVTGAREIEAAMRELGVRAANRIARSALTRSGTPIVRRMKELAPYDPDPDEPGKHLRDSIGKRLRRQRSGSSSQTLRIGVERPKSRIFHLLEFGTVHMAARPFARPAMDEKSQEALQVMTEAMRAGIERETAKLRTK
jgi:HK97 gp10 family phage protein